MLIKSLREIKLDKANFPIFYWDSYLTTERELNDKIDLSLFVSESIQGIIVFSVTKLKIIKKGQLHYSAVDFNGNELCEKLNETFMNEFIEFLNKNSLCDIILPPQHFSNFHSIPKKSSFFEMGILYVDISSNELHKQIGSENRRQIRIAKENGVQILFGNQYFDEFYILYVETSKRKNIPYHEKEFFKKQINRMPDNCLIGIAKVEGIIQAGVFDWVDNKFSYSLYSCTAEKLSYKGIKKHLIFSEYEYLEQIGVQKYYFGGNRPLLTKSSDLWKIQDFKRSMGAKIQEGCHFIYVFSPIKYGVFQILLTIKSKILGKNQMLFNTEGLKIEKNN
jgi:hypothetical protein